MALLAALLLPEIAPAAPVTPHSNPRWLAQGNGEPLFLCGPADPEDFFFRGSENPDGTRNGDQQAIVDKIVGTGANSFYVIAVRSHGGDGSSSHNPWINHDEDDGLNQDILDQWDGWLSQIDAAGIVTFFVIYDDGSEPWSTGTSVGTAERDFFRDLVNRFEHLDNLIWCIGEEYEEAYTATRVELLAAAVDEDDDYDHPITVSQLNGTTFHFPTDPNLSSFAMQINDTLVYNTIHGRVKSAFSNAAGQYNVNVMEIRFHYTTREETRKRCWAAAMGGGYVMVHRMFIIDTPVEAMEDCGRLVSFFQSTPFDEMEPHDELARGDANYVFGDADAGWIVYAEAAAGPIGLSIPPGYAGPYDLRWFDCESGVSVEQTGVPLIEGDNLASIPGGIGNEVAVSVTPSTAAVSVQSGLRWLSWGNVKSLFR
ncbi:MAG: hypothetical protein DHS20C21_18680 [Gemmatimonadota bacterium]|nr:MAG: hypothetical protein DHS20C21_18680 [Gemmatimonadota bacterium]